METRRGRVQILIGFLTFRVLAEKENRNAISYNSEGGVCDSNIHGG